MRDKRPRVNEAAITLVQSSNPQDEAFVVNFNDDFYLDLDKDFTSSIPELKEALERIDSRGSTALYDAIIGSLDHLKKAIKGQACPARRHRRRGQHQPQFPRENHPRNSEDRHGHLHHRPAQSRKAKKAPRNAPDAPWKKSPKASGGVAFFPENVEDVHNISLQVAHDIRNQYTLAYYPSNTKRDGTFRAVTVEVIPPRGRGKLVARTRNGYYAPSSPGSAAAGN